MLKILVLSPTKLIPLYLPTTKGEGRVGGGGVGGSSFSWFMLSTSSSLSLIAPIFNSWVLSLLWRISGAYFLGIEASNLGENLHITRTKYVTNLLKQAHIDSAKPYSSPTVNGQKLVATDSDPFPNPTPYCDIAGAL